MAPRAGGPIHPSLRRRLRSPKNPTGPTMTGPVGAPQPAHAASRRECLRRPNAPVPVHQEPTRRSPFATSRRRVRQPLPNQLRHHPRHPRRPRPQRSKSKPESRQVARGAGPCPISVNLRPDAIVSIGSPVTEGREFRVVI